MPAETRLPPSLSHALSLSRAHAFSLSLSCCFSRARSLSLSLPRALSLSRARSLARALSFAVSRCLSSRSRKMQRDIRRVRRRVGQNREGVGPLALVSQPRRCCRKGGKAASLDWQTKALKIGEQKSTNIDWQTSGFVCQSNDARLGFQIS